MIHAHLPTSIDVSLPTYTHIDMCTATYSYMSKCINIDVNTYT